MSVPTRDPQGPWADGDTPTSDWSDKRHSPRVPCDIPVEYEFEGRPPQRGQFTNIGTGGALLTTHVAIPVGATLILRFPIPPSNRPIQTVGTAKWVNQWMVGVQFVGLNPWETREIWKYYAKASCR